MNPASDVTTPRQPKPVSDVHQEDEGDGRLPGLAERLIPQTGSDDSGNPVRTRAASERTRSPQLDGSPALGGPSPPARNRKRGTLGTDERRGHRGDSGLSGGAHTSVPQRESPSTSLAIFCTLRGGRLNIRAIERLGCRQRSGGATAERPRLLRGQPVAAAGHDAHGRSRVDRPAADVSVLAGRVSTGLASHPP